VGERRVRQTRPGGANDNLTNDTSCFRQIRGDLLFGPRIPRFFEIPAG
jgi:hypothetical protein